MQAIKTSQHQLIQDNKKYIIVISLIPNKIKLASKDSMGQIHQGLFALSELCKMSKYFKPTHTLDQIYDYLNGIVDKQRFSIFVSDNKLNIIFHLINKDNIVIPLTKINLNAPQIINQNYNIQQSVLLPKTQQVQNIQNINRSQMVQKQNYISQIKTNNIITNIPQANQVISQKNVVRDAITNAQITPPINASQTNYYIKPTETKIENYVLNTNIKSVEKPKIITETTTTKVDDLVYITEIEKMRKEKSVLQNEINTFKNQIISFKNQNIALSNQIKVLKNENNVLKNEKIFLNSEISSLKNGNLALKKEINTLKIGNSSLNSLKIENNALNAIKNENNLLKNENIALKTEINALRNGNNVLNSAKIDDNTLNVIKNENNILKNENNVLKNENNVLKEENNSLKNQIVLLNKDIDAIDGQNDEIRKMYEDLESEANNFRQQAEEVIKENELLHGQIEELNNNYISINAEIENIKNENIELKNNLDQPKENINDEEINEIVQENESLKKEVISLRSQMDLSQSNREEGINQKQVKGDIIHDMKELDLITKKINNEKNKKIIINLLYKASVDGDKAEDFHTKCDKAKGTIILVETKKGKRFGGYTTRSWEGSCIEKEDNDAFVFSFDKMKTYNILDESNAIGCYPNFGPVFRGCQIKIFDHAFTKGGTTYEKECCYNTKEDFELNDGEKTYGVKEIEVYEVIFE